MMDNGAVDYILNFCMKNNIIITDTEDKDDSCLFFSDKMILVYYKDNNLLTISFHVITPADKAAEMCMMIREMEGINIAISDVYVLSNDGVLTGQEAVNYIDSVKRDEVIKNFIQEQQKLQVLCFTQGYEC